MNIKKLFCAGDNTTSRRRKVETENEGLYADMLGLNRNFRFVLTKSTVSDQTEFDDVVKKAEGILRGDLKRFGEDFSVIPPEFKDRLSGVIGSMTIIGDDDGKLLTYFHRRDNDGLWDGISKKYPEKNTTGKYKHEIFFILDEDEED